MGACIFCGFMCIFALYWYVLTAIIMPMVTSLPQDFGGDQSVSMQIIPNMTPEELRVVFEDPKMTRGFVDCIIKFQTGLCPDFLRPVSNKAPEIFVNAGRCISCGQEEQKFIDSFLEELRVTQAEEFIRMITGLADRDDIYL